MQYYVLPEKVYDAFYKLDDASRQITSYVFDVVRAQVPKIKVDDVCEKKDDIANIVKAELAQVMEGFGYGILKALVTRDSVDEFQRSVPGTTAKDVMNLVLMTQYFDTLKEIGGSSRSNTILIPLSPSSLASLSEQIRNAMIEANQTVEGARPEALSGVGYGD